MYNPKILMGLGPQRLTESCLTHEGEPKVTRFVKVKVSYDGETVADTGETVKDAVEAFKEEGYEKAACKCYVDLWGSLMTKKGAELAEEDRPLVQIQLSPESVKKFKAFQVEVGFKQARCLVAATSVVVLRAQRGEWKGNRFGYCTFALK